MANDKGMVVSFARHRAKECSTCDQPRGSACDNVCPMRLHPRNIKRMMFSCVQCGQCLSACEDSQIAQHRNPNLVWSIGVDAVRETIRQRKDGSQFHISLTISPVKNAVGQVVGASKIARDITEKKRAENARELLLHEIKHRVKNTLGTVQAIATQTFRESAKNERDAFAGRLRALSNPSSRQSS